jgi:glycosyltransferase involved in cell wall biosynthesis
MKIGIVGAVGSLSGYAELVRETTLGLHKLGVDIELKVLDEKLLKTSQSSLSKETLDLIKECKVKEFSPGIPIFNIGTPPQYEIDPTRFCCGVGLWEAYSLPPIWLQLMNSMNLIITYSEFNKQVFIKQGLDKSKIEIVPPAVDSTRFTPEIEPFYVSNIKSFCVLFLSQLILRKGYDRLILAAMRTFRKNDDVCIILKAPPPSNQLQIDSMMKKLEAIKKEAGPSKVPLYVNYSAIPVEKVPMAYQIVRKRVPDKIYPYLGTDEMPRGVFCLPSLGEGVGYPYLEAMSSGVLTLGTSLTGSSFLNTSNSVIIESGPPIRNIFLELEHALYRNSPMPNVDIDSISNSLLKAYNIGIQERETITKRARLDMEGYSYEKSCKAILKAIETHI